MDGALIFVGVGFLLAVGAMGLAAAALAVRNAERSLKLAGDRMERLLEEEKARFLSLLREERRRLKEDMERERGRWAAELDLERRARLESELRGDRLELEVRRESEKALRGGVAPPLGGPVVDGLLASPRRAGGTKSTPRSPAGLPETSASGLGPGSPVEKPRLGVWHPHPDDDVVASSAPRAARDTAGGPSSPGGGRRGNAPVEMFRRHYDKYLENYAGYVELAEGLYRTRAAGGVAGGGSSGAVEEREWKESLRRVMDGIERTTTRLDILEEHNPGLATDDRVSRRAGVARRHSRLEGKGRLA